MHVQHTDSDYRIYRLALGWPGPFVANAYLVDDGELTLVDAGFPLNQRTIRNELERIGYDVRDIDRVVLTHYDLDHVGGLARIADELDAPVYMGKDDLEIVKGDADPSLLHHKGVFHRLARSVYSLPDELDLRPVGDGDRLGGFTAVHTPGHNPGHTAYVHNSSGTGFVGDLVWSDNGELRNPFIIDSYDSMEMKESVAKLLEAYPCIERLYMGHGSPVEDDAASRLHSVLG